MSGTSTKYEKGFFTLGILSGYSESRTLNADATFSKFRGVNYGFQFEVSLNQSESGDIRLFGNLLQEELKEKSGSFKLLGNGMGGGLKFYANPYFYMQAGYGEIRQKYTTSAQTYSMKNKYLSSAIGIDVSLTESLFLGLAIQYMTNPIKKTSSITSNSFVESGQAFLVLTWSPPITIINQTISSGR